MHLLGIPTGRCIDSIRLNGTKVCEINAWCPTELEPRYVFELNFLILINLKKFFFILRGSQNLVRNVLNYTIFLRNTVKFKAFNKKEYLDHSEIKFN